MGERTGSRDVFQSVGGDTGTPFSTVREKTDGKGHYARIMTRGLCAHNDREILRA